MCPNPPSDESPDFRIASVGGVRNSYKPKSDFEAAFLEFDVAMLSSVSKKKRELTVSGVKATEQNFEEFWKAFCDGQRWCKMLPSETRELNLSPCKEMALKMWLTKDDPETST